MLKRLICKLLHGRYHEIGYSLSLEMSKEVQVWSCQWWCPKCGRTWHIYANVDRLVVPEWEPPFPVRQDAIDETDRVNDSFDKENSVEESTLPR